jgi:hypothetical protein
MPNPELPQHRDGNIRSAIARVTRYKRWTAFTTFAASTGLRPCSERAANTPEKSP